MVTIREVARESGVSAATVSHVLNGTRRVEPETAARVRAAIEKLGYRPLREYDRYGLRGIRLAGFFRPRHGDVRLRGLLRPAGAAAGGA